MGTEEIIACASRTRIDPTEAADGNGVGDAVRCERGISGLQHL
jgi:hypothetical protein